VQLLVLLGVKSARNYTMIDYFIRVLRRHLFALLLLTAIAYISMSSFGIAQEQSANSVAFVPDQNPSVDEDANPYAAIIHANVFHLSEPPKPVEKPDQVLLTLPKVNISGFVRHSDQPIRALFATVPKDPKELPRYFNLAEGEKDGFLQVTKVYPNQDAVDVIIDGTAVTLTTKSNSFIQPLPLPSKGGLPNAAAIAYNPPVQQPISQTPPPYSGGVVVAGGSFTPTGSSGVTTIGGNGGGNVSIAGGSSGISGGGAGFPNSGGSVASSVNNNTALRSIPTRGQPLQNYPPVYVAGSLDEAAALSAVSAAASQPEIESGQLPPFPLPSR
jgi:hypothetical protein